MMSRLVFRRDVQVVEDRHVLRAGDHGLVDVLGGDAAERGRELALGEGAARAGDVVAHRAVDAEQLARPLARSPSPSRYSLVGDRRGRGRATRRRSASAAICSSVNCGGFSSACGPGTAIGMRPVPTWKSTAAAPTPIRRRGRRRCLRRSRPWQLAQLAAKSFSPSSTSLATLLAGLGGRAGREGRVGAAGREQPDQQQGRGCQRRTPTGCPGLAGGAGSGSRHGRGRNPICAGYLRT